MIPVVDLSRGKRAENEAIKQAINRVLRSGRYLNGPESINFNKEFASYLKIKYCFGVGSGTDAIVVALKALGISQGDQVIVPANVYPSVFALIRAQVDPLLCDVSPRTLNLDTESLNKLKLTKKTKAILSVHLYGNSAGLAQVQKFAKANKLSLIEDCSHAHGAKFGDKFVGTIGDIGCFSFYPTKNLACLGDGGALVTNSKSLAKTIQSILSNGEKARFVSGQIGYSSHLDEIQAAILRVRLKLLDHKNKLRRQLAKLYQAKLKSLPVSLPEEVPDNQPVYLNFVIRTSQRDQLKKFLTNRQIGTQIHYPLPLHLQPSLKYLGYKKGDFPNSEKVSKTVLSLPMYPELTKPEVAKICQSVSDFFSQ